MTHAFSFMDLIMVHIPVIFMDNQLNHITNSLAQAIPSTEITLPVIMTRGIAGSQVTLCGECCTGPSVTWMTQ